MTDFDSARPNTLDRRRVLQGAAWAAPVVALSAAAPAASASPCSSLRTGNLVFNGTGANYTRTSTTQGSATIPLSAGDTPIAVTFVSSFINNNVTGTNRAVYAVPTTTNSALNMTTSTDGLDFWQSSDGANIATQYGMRIRIRFDRPVTNLVFRFNQLTRNTAVGNQFVDRMWSSITPTSSVLGGTASGAGTAASPFTAPSAVGTVGFATATYASIPANTDLDIHYNNGSGAATSQMRASLGAMQFQARGRVNC